MNLNFQKISLDRQVEYNSYLSRCSQKASDYSFVNLWGWAEEHGLHWAWTENFVWIMQTKPAVCNWPPVGAWEKVDWKLLFNKHVTVPAHFVRIPSELCRTWKDQEVKMTIEESRGDWDYICNRHELAELKGNRFHKKKNLVNRFKNKHDYRYAHFTDEMVDQALGMQQDWCEWRDCESVDSLSAENRVIPRVLRSWNKLQRMTGGAITVNNNLVAYTIAEYIDDETILIHFEKGNTDYRGVYQAINQMFLEQIKEEFKQVNRMQDLDDEGLRKAKLSYRPIGFLKKYR
ncbi:MAG: DUF2156 domain-containing protein, partial [Deltaproteobacteria bacterium]|nr:DUF2156 domain-containing protein [Deltaproteobacteria bacterium]